MNFFGKILTGLICIVALFLMWVSIMVYATHKNWKADADSLTKKLDQATATNDQLQSERRSLESRLKAEIEAAVVADQDGAFAAGRFHRLAHAADDLVHRLRFGDGHAQRVVELDAGELQCGSLNIGAG